MDFDSKTNEFRHIFAYDISYMASFPAIQCMPGAPGLISMLFCWWGLIVFNEKERWLQPGKARSKWCTLKLNTRSLSSILSLAFLALLCGHRFGPAQCAPLCLSVTGGSVLQFWRSIQSSTGRWSTESWKFSIGTPHVSICLLERSEGCLWRVVTHSDINCTLLCMLDQTTVHQSGCCSCSWQRREGIHLIYFDFV